jgi:hypothetical protein
MTVLIKYPVQTKERNKVFFKKQKLINLDWAKWAGWFDTDGCFTTFRNQRRNLSDYWIKNARLELKDRQPVELFSKMFETSLRCRTMKTITPEPYKYKYITNIHGAQLDGEKGQWFVKNIFPYLVKQEKKDYAATLLGYKPESKDFKDWTTDEVTYYLATAMEGDGNFHIRSGKKTKSIAIEIKSSDVQYLSDIKYLVEEKLGFVFQLHEGATYETKQGIKTKYRLNMYCSRRNPDNLPFFQNLLEDNVMTLDRKKQKVKEFVGQF